MEVCLPEAALYETFSKLSKKQTDTLLRWDPFVGCLQETLQHLTSRASVLPYSLVKVDFKVVPGGREITGEMPEGLDYVLKSTDGLPLTDSYPMPFYRMRGV